jgi:hypothetical protein
MIAAAAEAVVAPDLADVEAEAEIVGKSRSQRDRLRDGRVVLAAKAALAAARSSLPCQRGPSEKTRTAMSSHLPSSRSCCR